MFLRILSILLLILAVLVGYIFACCAQYNILRRRGKYTWYKVEMAEPVLLTFYVKTFSVVDIKMRYKGCVINRIEKVSEPDSDILTETVTITHWDPGLDKEDDPVYERIKGDKT